MKSILKRNPSIWFSILLIAVGVIVLFFFFRSIDKDFDIMYSGNIKLTETAQVGDFIGGVVGTIFALAGTVLLVLTLMIQIKTSEEASFESSFFELIKLHKENVAETRYKRVYEGVDEEFHHRKAFQVMFKEFEECYSDVFKFTRHIESDDFLEANHKRILQKIIDDNNLVIDVYEFAKFDLCYCIFFFGVSNDGERILRERYKNKFKTRTLYQLFFFLKLKPKSTAKQNASLKIWQEMRNRPKSEFFETINLLYDNRTSKKLITTNKFTSHFSQVRGYIKFYGGHQHRLSHYFRNLFQTFEYLEDSSFNDDKKYGFGKILRSQLSTYEQLLFFCNSISSLGWKWEYKSDNNHQHITKYKLIKNIQGIAIKEIRPEHLYPKLKF